ncbi:MAG TPA: pepsin/retropepsin-like aspartic protease family protein [Candidatus Acidoferrales bacterium]|nr:pepsin/retropepsin-like aspartic protease family protein [Candidatus Acidoferrales bacterium]
MDAIINGRHLWFTLDTGTNGIILDSDAARELGLREPNPTEAVADMDVGPLHANDVRFYLTRYGHRFEGPRVVGLIGAPFFRSNVVTIDYQHKSITVYPATSFDPSQAGVAVPLYFDDHMPFVETRVDGRNAAMLLDTAAFGTFLFSRFAAGINLGPPLGRESVTLGISGSAADSTLYRISALDIGGTRLLGPLAYVSSDTRPFAGGFYADGILGRNVLANFVLTIDYRDAVAYFRT